VQIFLCDSCDTLAIVSVVGDTIILRLDEISQIHLLESMLKDLLAPKLAPVLDEINERGTYAILKVAE